MSAETFGAARAYFQAKVSAEGDGPVHCPNGGTRTASEQKFCRACGMALDRVAHILAEQLPELLAAERRADTREV